MSANALPAPCPACDGSGGGAYGGAYGPGQICYVCRGTGLVLPHEAEHERQRRAEERQRMYDHQSAMNGMRVFEASPPEEGPEASDSDFRRRMKARRKRIG